MYTILESSMTRYSAGVQMSRVTILVDDAPDVPEPHDTWDSGSICVISEDHSYKILNNEREWV